jgi:hypothetical protein
VPGDGDHVPPLSDDLAFDAKMSDYVTFLSKVIINDLILL